MTSELFDFYIYPKVIQNSVSLIRIVFQEVLCKENDGMLRTFLSALLEGLHQDRYDRCINLVFHRQDAGSSNGFLVSLLLLFLFLFLTFFMLTFLNVLWFIELLEFFDHEIVRWVLVVVILTLR